MFWKKEKANNKKPKTICLQRFQPFFTTTDGLIHEGTDRYKWVNANGLLCSVPDYLMISINSDGYIKDNKNIMYPLANVISIEWKLLEEKIVIDNFYHEYQIFFNNDEVEKMNEYVN